MNEKYYKERTPILTKNGIEAAPPEKNRFPILLNGRSACCATFKHIKAAVLILLLVK